MGYGKVSLRTHTAGTKASPRNIHGPDPTADLLRRLLTPEHDAATAVIAKQHSPWGGQRLNALILQWRAAHLAELASRLPEVDPARKEKWRVVLGACT